MTLRKKLILGTVLIIVISLALTGTLSTLLINRQFNYYLLTEHNRIIEQIKSDAENILENNSLSALKEMDLYVASSNYFVEIIDDTGQTVYLSSNFSSGTMMGRRTSLSKIRNMPMYSMFQVDSFIMSITNGKQYLLNIAYNSELSKAEDAAKFISTLYQSIILSFFISVLFGVILSVFISKTISNSIVNVSSKAKAIISGNYISEKFDAIGIVEIDSLNESMCKLEATLSNQEALRKDIVETLSHEVKTPLTVLKSHIDGFADGVFQPDEKRLLKCRDEILRIEDLMKRIDELEDLSSAGFVMNYSSFYIDEELSNVSQILEPQFRKRHMSIENLFGEHIQVELDRYKLRQILYNLLSNAYKFSDENSMVKIQGTTENSLLTIHVENRGLVVPKDEWERIFESHYRSSHADKYSPHGKGLGLKISKNLAEFLGGNLTLLKSDDDSTVFSLVLPINRNEV